MTFRPLLWLAIMVAIGCSESTTAPPDQATPVLGALSGTITNEANGSPVVGATVSVTPGGRTAATDSQGRFSILDLEAGVYTVQISREGFGAVSTAIALDAGSSEVQLHLALSPKPTASPGGERFEIRNTIVDGTLDDGGNLTFLVELNVLPGPTLWSIVIRDTLNVAFGPLVTSEGVQVNLGDFPDATIEVTSGRSFVVDLGSVDPTDGFINAFTLSVPSPPADDLYCNTVIVTASWGEEVEPASYTMCIT